MLQARGRGGRGLLMAMRWGRVALFAAAAAYQLGGCGSRIAPIGESATATPTFVPGPAAVTFLATLQSGPSVSGAIATAGEFTCGGSAVVTIDPTPRGTLNLAVAYYELSVTGCPPGTTITEMHIHPMPLGSQDVWIGSDLRDFVLVNGSGTTTSINLGVPPARAEVVIARPDNFFLHFHSKNNPGALMRGLLRPK